MTYSVSENGLIGSDQQWPEPPADGILVPDEVFQQLRRFAFEYEQADVLLTYTVQKGRELIRIRNYVGLLPLSGRTYFEILPKIEPPTNPRSLLLTMLRHVRNSPFRTLTTAHTSATPLPLWDVFVRAFLDTVEPLIQQGIQRAYVSVEKNEQFWKGKFQVARQQRENACHAERLAVVYDSLTANVPPNRILKTTLVSLTRQTKNVSNQRRLQQFLAVLDEVPVSESVPNDLQASRRTSRLFARYEPALRWAEALLNGQSLGVKDGAVASLSLLFLMERVFEEYVATGIRTYWPEAGEVTIQESSAHLVDEHVGSPKFKLRPDILIRHEDKMLVLDTKWKQVNGQDKTGNYGIEQADLYQLYAYGKKYAANDLFLVYPANKTFRQPLDVFGYDATTRLHVVPFDLSNSLAKEVEKLATYAFSF
ncbi:McrC family protein [Spirosoma sp. KNUC1025]|uniref:McrC family protein n=1 Tax=Spirosoma sp. KNUC1025 TaxID=2894082 RepID=UPI00386FB3B0|nr:McrC family protein [Spirosoma sp. KNUC1025]